MDDAAILAAIEAQIGEPEGYKEEDASQEGAADDADTDGEDAQGDDGQEEAESDSDEAEGEADEGDSAAEGDKEGLGIEPPQMWKKEDKEVWESSQDAKLKEVLLRREKEMNAAYTKKTQEVAEQRKQYDPIAKAFEPYKEGLERNGFTPAGYIQKLMDIDKNIQKEPAKEIKALVDRFGLTASDLGFSDADPFETEEERAEKARIKKLEAENSSLKERDKRLEQASSTQQTQRIMDDFANTTDENGELKFPHFKNEEVKFEMGILMQKAAARGERMTLEEAYKLAPTAKTAELEAGKKAKEIDATTQKRLKAAEAKRKGTAVDTGGKGIKQKFNEDDYLSREIGKQLTAS